MSDDTELLRRYAREGSEDAFAEVVRRHVGFVYHSALRQVGGDTHCAEDVTQAVFSDLARKAAAISRHPAMVSWLCTSTRFAAHHAMRTKRRWREHEREACMINENLSDNTPSADWERLRPAIDDALCSLNERDRQAVLLRFFAGLSLGAVGAKLSVSEDAARMRVDRALEKLRGQLERRGISSTATALGLILGSQPAMAVPPSMAAAVTGSALAGSATLSSGAIVATAILMSKKILVTAVILLAIGFAYFEFDRSRRANEAARALNAERDALNVRLRKAEQSAKDANQQLQETARQTPVAPTPAQADASRLADAGTAPAPAGAFPFSSSSDSPSGPSYRFPTPAKGSISDVQNQIRASSSERFSTAYSPVFDQLGFTLEQRNRFIELQLNAADNLQTLVGQVVAQVPGADAAAKKDAADIVRQNVTTELQQSMTAAFGESAVQAIATFQASLPAAKRIGIPLGPQSPATPTTAETK